MKEAIRCLRHRGPDRCGWHRDAQVQLGHALLAVVDVTAAADQPMFSDDRSLSLVFNGEFYSFRSHRQRLQRQGHRFRTRSDAEVILKLYQLLGNRFLEEVNGPFAIGIWDFRHSSLFLARDRLGEKPLYYTTLLETETSSSPRRSNRCCNTPR